MGSKDRLDEIRRQSTPRNSSSLAAARNAALTRVDLLSSNENNRRTAGLVRSATEPIGDGSTSPSEWRSGGLAVLGVLRNSSSSGTAGRAHSSGFAAVAARDESRVPGDVLQSSAVQQQSTASRTSTQQQHGAAAIGTPEAVGEGDGVPRVSRRGITTRRFSRAPRTTSYDWSQVSAALPAPVTQRTWAATEHLSTPSLNIPHGSGRCASVASMGGDEITARTTSNTLAHRSCDPRVATAPSCRSRSSSAGHRPLDPTTPSTGCHAVTTPEHGRSEEGIDGGVARAGMVRRTPTNHREAWTPPPPVLDSVERRIGRDTTALRAVSARLDAAATAIDVVEMGMRSASDSLDSLLHLLDVRPAGAAMMDDNMTGVVEEHEDIPFPPTEATDRPPARELPSDTNFLDRGLCRRPAPITPAVAPTSPLRDVSSAVSPESMTPRRDPLGESGAAVATLPPIDRGEDGPLGRRAPSVANWHLLRASPCAGESDGNEYSSGDIDSGKREPASKFTGDRRREDRRARSAGASGSNTISRLDPIIRSRSCLAMREPAIAAAQRGFMMHPDEEALSTSVPVHRDFPASGLENRISTPHMFLEQRGLSRRQNLDLGSISTSATEAGERTALSFGTPCPENDGGEGTREEQAPDGRLLSDEETATSRDIGTGGIAAGVEQRASNTPIMSFDRGSGRNLRGTVGENRPSRPAQELEAAMDGIDAERGRLTLEIARLRGQQNDSLRHLLRLQQEQFVVRQRQVSTLSDIVNSFGRTVDAAGELSREEDSSLGRISGDVVSTLRRMLRLLSATAPATAANTATTSSSGASPTIPANPHRLTTPPSATTVSMLSSRPFSDTPSRHPALEASVNELDSTPGGGRAAQPSSGDLTQEVIDAALQALPRLAAAASAISGARRLQAFLADGADNHGHGVAAAAEGALAPNRRCSLETIAALPDAPRYGFGSAIGSSDNGGSVRGCVICLSEDCTAGELLCLLPCEHVFHRACVGKWLRVQASCPTCRRQVPNLGVDSGDASSPAPPEVV